MNLANFNKKKELDNCLDYIKIDKLKNATLKLIKDNYNKTKLNNAIKVCEYTMFLLKEDGLLNQCAYSQSNSIIIAGALLHNLSYDYGKQSFQKLFDARAKIEEISYEEETYLPPDLKMMLYQLIECQLGKQHPIKQLIPNSGNPAYYISLSCSLYYKKELKREISEVW